MAPDNTAKILELNTVDTVDGDGEEPGGTDIFQYTIDVVDNGFILHTLCDGDTVIEVFHNIDDVFQSIRESF